MKFQEKFLFHIWDQRHLVDDLRSVNGKTVKIVYPGQYNTSNGPDFKNAVLYLDGEMLQGDVEIHLTTGDWQNHQHQEDPAYNEVILHAVFEHRGVQSYITREDGTAVEIMELKNQIDDNIAKLLTDYQQTDLRVKRDACDFFTLSEGLQLRQLLNSYGMERFFRKCQRFNAALLLKDFDQIIYEGMLEAAGYDKNRFHTLALAQHFSWKTLRQWSAEGMKPQTLAAIFIYAAGLQKYCENILGKEFAEELRREYEYQSFTADKLNLSWNLFRIRPAAHPVRRLYALSFFLCAVMADGLLNFWTDVFNNGSKSIREAVSDIETAIRKKTRISDNDVKLGKSAIEIITANIVLPILYLYASKTNDSKLCEDMVELYRNYPSQAENYITSFMLNYLTESRGAIPGNRFITQQGLMHLYYGYCKYQLCNLCLQERDNQLQKM